jgi:DNA repair protein RadC
MDEAKKPFKSESSNLHAAHRDRMYRRFAATFSLDNFQPHEILEMLLYRNIPLQNTSEIAHRILNKYGNLLNALRAPANELTEIKGMTQKAAYDLNIIFSAFKLLPSLEQSSDSIVLNTLERVLSFVRTRMLYEEYEIAYIICLDATDKVMNVNAKTEYLPQNVALNTRMITKTALSYNASKVVLVHNHPSGDPTPSPEDDAVTKDAAVALATIEVALLDHVIIARDRHYSYAMHNFILRSLEDDKWFKIRDQLSCYIKLPEVRL